MYWSFTLLCLVQAVQIASMLQAVEGFAHEVSTQPRIVMKEEQCHFALPLSTD